MERVADKIFLAQGLCNCYYIDDDKKVLIDAGAFVDRPVELVILTHCHYDHTAFLRKILEKNQGCNVAVSLKDREAVEEASEKTADWMFQAEAKPIRVSMSLKEGQVINTGNYNLKVLETPGHTDGSIVLWDSKKKLLFSGDTVFVDGYGRTDFPSGSQEAMCHSLKRIARLKPKIVLAGH